MTQPIRSAPAAAARIAVVKRLLLGLMLGSSVLAAGPAASPAAAEEDIFLVSPQVMEFYENTYLKTKRPGAMAVSADGLRAGYSYCPDYRCKMNPSARDLALRACTSAGGRDCRIFAVGTTIQVEYKVMGQ